ncbi:GNAT family N-acetyltransferase [Dethiothermospora halolimnae]|uniref:GNAT family N-acetyltransferase n=1 Tax=Dethiothermospora halolimnae TaxID=3114390 RepID=UPI003CCBE00E
MDKKVKRLEKDIKLEYNIQLKYQTPEVFFKYYSIYYGKKYSNYYFRKSSEELLEKVKYIDSGYFILKGEKIIGGVLIKPNFISDLFIVPPYDDYGEILEKVLKLLKTISNKNEDILVQEVVEELVPLYESKGCKIGQQGFWMIRPTEEIEYTVPDNYIVNPIVEEDKGEIASVIVEAYKANPSFRSVGTKKDYIGGIESFIKNHKNNKVLDDSSKVVINRDTKEIVGVCSHMEFEGFPLITQLAVKPGHQGKGIGSYLLKNSINHTKKKYLAIRLYVYKDNPAMKLYRSMGFLNDGTLNDMLLV